MQALSVRVPPSACNICLPRLLRQIYAAASSLSTRRTHLGNLHEPEYLALIQARNLPNKLPAATLRQREEKRAKDAARTLFSVKAFEDQLVTVIVSNDLVISTSSSCPGTDFRSVNQPDREPRFS